MPRKLHFLDEQDPLDRLFPTAGSLLSRIDEYSLYSHLLGFEPWPNKPYRSMVRDDDDFDNNPSWALYKLPNPGDYEFAWRDYARGTRGNVFDLARHVVPEYKNLRKSDIIKDLNRRLNEGLNLPRAGTVKHPEGFGEYMEIRVKSRPMNTEDLLYWSAIGVDENQLRRYNTTAITHYWVNQWIHYAPRTAFAYRIEDRYQLYFPFSRPEKKWRTSLRLGDLHGYSQLPPKGDICIVTKSRKDVMALDSWGFPSIAPTGEHAGIDDSIFEELSRRFTRVFALMDNDLKHNKGYPIPYIYIPESSGTKDPTDFARKYGVGPAISLINKLTEL